ncbi:ATP-grasp domain-containing protein [Heliobacterium gestii]|uniref:ATP-grasp domain-containing protein n=1 Tax=Heliomicrobium gestii TaxID=2699 RepID=A0A845LA48_HELGE|nr:ATP-grasp domain-containing protein [Heliomicrobium gestii]MBM7865559.1 putative ATP-grasp superfamily ATP-dependent carboligase [Heliomicrobium gestii]MZP41810.1 ATP-grasp domain-containing protein [Heliomicrobium gestii]
MKNCGVLALVHQGKSWCKEIHRKLKQLGLETYIITTQYENDADVVDIKDTVEWFETVDGSTLSREKVFDVIAQLESDGKKVVACIAPIEAQRLISAEVNMWLGAKDCSPASIMIALDKYLCRKALIDAGCSKVRIEELTESSYDIAKNQSESKFIKPRRAAYSFGTFKLDSSRSISDIEILTREMQEDPYVKLLTKDGVEFVIEDEIVGVEYSAEMIAYNGEGYIVAIHQKEISQSELTVLEDRFYNPSDLNTTEITDLAIFLKRCLQTLSFHYGCFHVEFKKTAKGWEIIEVNPRPGGVLINDSIRIRSGRESLIELWLYVLLLHVTELNTINLLAKASATFVENRIVSRESEIGMFQKTYFAERGKTVSSVKKNRLSVEPDIYFCNVKKGDTIPNTHKEHLVCCALWKYPVNDRERLEEIKAQSDNLFEICYND